VKLVIDKILNLDDGEHRFYFDCKASEIDLTQTDFEGNEIFPRSLQTDVILTKTGYTFYLNITCRTITHLLCDRCLTDIDQEQSASVQVVYTNNKHQASDSGDDALRSIDIRQNNSIGIDKDVRDMMILALPTKTLCRPECKGLCTLCGADWNNETCEHWVEEQAAILA
jgi:uncharacterized protein